MFGNKDKATVESSGVRLEKYIEGVKIRHAATQIDERGELCELYDPRWTFTTEPLVYVYSSFIRPGKIKGWVYHREQTDRLFMLCGFMKIVLFDLRETSPSKGMLNEIHLTERNRGLITIPPFVAHAVQNIGIVDAVFINMPTRPYNHDNPDKYRIDHSDIPYSFDKGQGW